jgi:hypothetical protein
MFSLLDGSHIASEKNRTTFGPPQPPCKLMHGMSQRFSTLMVHVLHVLHMVVEGLMSLQFIIASFHVGGGEW